MTRWYGLRRISALTVLTLVAGLASTVFAPLTALLAAHLDWRQTYLVLLMILAAITIPGHFWVYADAGWLRIRGESPAASRS